jgi:sugar phosphate isomerase/epimerase
MNDQSRRDFLKKAGIAAAASSLPVSQVFARRDSEKPHKVPYTFEFGMASYTFRSFTLDQAIEMTKRLGLKKLTLKDKHLALDSSEQQIKEAAEKIKAAGLDLDSCGVVYMKKEEEVKQAFSYAKMLGLKLIIGAPDPSLLEVSERFVKETDISLAIHNHGPTDKLYPSPEDAYKLIDKMDKRMGLCIDIGHTQRFGLDPSVQVERFIDRLFDIHIKDVSQADAKGTTVEMGRGVIDIPKLFKTIIHLNYSKTLHFEFEKDPKDPLPGVAESIGYAHGVLAAI